MSCLEETDVSLAYMSLWGSAHGRLAWVKLLVRVRSLLGRSIRNVRLDQGVSVAMQGTDTAFLVTANLSVLMIWLCPAGRHKGGATVYG